MMKKKIFIDTESDNYSDIGINVDDHFTDSISVPIART